MDAVTDYVAHLLRVYASRQAFRVEQVEGSVEINCEVGKGREWWLGRVFCCLFFFVGGGGGGGGGGGASTEGVRDGMITRKRVGGYAG